MQTLRFLGRGSAFNVSEGNTCAYYIQDNTLTLIDCGESIFQRIIEKNILNNINQVQVLITHLNSDHVGSLSSLIYYCKYVKKIPIKIFHPNMQMLITLLELNGNGVYDDYDLWEDPENIFIVQVEHIEHMKCYGYVIKLEDKTIYYSGDSNMIPYNILRDFKNNTINEIYQDTCVNHYKGNVHLSLKTLCDIIPSTYRKRVYCMHIDKDELITSAKIQGFNVVETI